MSRQRKELKAVLGELAAEDAGPHPDPAELAAYAAGELAAEEQERLREHLALCADCLALLAEVDAFSPQPAASTAEEAATAREWQALAAQLDLGRPPAPVVSLAERRPTTRRPPAWATALAASLAVLCLGLSAWVASLRREVVDLTRPQLNTPIVDLYPASAPRGVEAAADVELPAAAPWFCVVLNPPPGTAAGRFRVEVLGADGALLWQGAGLETNELGSLTLTLPRHMFPPGDYRVRLRHQEDDTPIDEYPMRIAAAGQAEPAR